MRKITIYLEDADGETDKPTGLHVDRGDGSAVWLTGAELDEHTPEGSSRSLRGILQRLRDDAAPLPTREPVARSEAPTPERGEDGRLELV